MKIRGGWIIVLFAVFLALPVNSSAAQPVADPEPKAVLPEAELPEAVLPENVYDFGTVVEGSPVERKFVLKNQGKGPLQIIKIDSG